MADFAKVMITNLEKQKAVIEEQIKIIREFSTKAGSDKYVAELSKRAEKPRKMRSLVDPNKPK